jgi:hypothetical protein
MDNLKSEMPYRDPANAHADGIGGGRPGQHAGGNWESENPSRAKIEEHLGGVQYPATTADLVQHLRWQKAPLAAIFAVEQIPDRTYGSADEVHRELTRVVQ